MRDERSNPRTLKLGDREVVRMGLGSNRLTRKSQNVAFIRAAVEAGIGLIDTAHLYAGGDSEATIGEALDGSGQPAIVATLALKPAETAAAVRSLLPARGV
jgi:aryl-alcohol dehydrogenase-like predicted oxidoreductase